jgi:hypothetical protein
MSGVGFTVLVLTVIFVPKAANQCVEFWDPKKHAELSKTFTGFSLA